MSNSLWPYWLEPARLLCPWDSPGKNTGVGCCTLLQGIFLTQGLNSCLLKILYCRWILYHWATGETPSLSHLTPNTGLWESVIVFLKLRILLVTVQHPPSPSHTHTHTHTKKRILSFWLYFLGFVILPKVLCDFAPLLQEGQQNPPVRHRESWCY